MKRQNNSGYTERENGTALSINAEWAESAGKYIKGDFVKRYNVSRATFALLHECHVIEANEWHHVGKTFRRADFYEWADWNENDYSNATCETGSFGKIYLDNKNTVDALVKAYNVASVEEKEKPLFQVLAFFMDAEKAREKAASRVAFLAQVAEFAKKEAENKTNAEPYRKEIERLNKLREKWLQCSVKKGAIKLHERTRTNFDNFVCIREEMCGKYGWFEASWRYRLPIYRTGYELNAKQMKHYKGYDAKIVEVYRKANENNVRL